MSRDLSMITLNSTAIERRWLDLWAEISDQGNNDEAVLHVFI